MASGYCYIDRLDVCTHRPPVHQNRRGPTRLSSRFYRSLVLCSRLVLRLHWTFGLVSCSNPRMACPPQCKAPCFIFQALHHYLDYYFCESSPQGICIYLQHSPSIADDVWSVLLWIMRANLHMQPPAIVGSFAFALSGCRERGQLTSGVWSLQPPLRRPYLDAQT